MSTITINERIKIFRVCYSKNSKGKNYSQQQFADELGVSKGVINNIESNLVETKDYLIKLICKTFNVNEDWLRNGNEPIFNENSNKHIKELIKKYNLNQDERELIKRLTLLDENSRHKIIDFLFETVKQHIDEIDDEKIINLENVLEEKKKQQEPQQEMVKITARYGGIKYISKEEMDEIERTARVLTDEELDDFI